MFSPLRMNDVCFKKGKCNFMNYHIKSKKELTYFYFHVSHIFSLIFLLHCLPFTALPVIVNYTCHTKLSQERLLILIYKLSSKNLACSTCQMLEVSFNMTGLPGIKLTHVFYYMDYFTNFFLQ